MNFVYGCYLWGMGGMLSSPPMKMGGGSYFRASGRVCFFICTMGGLLYMGESQLGITLRGDSSTNFWPIGKRRTQVCNSKFVTEKFVKSDFIKLSLLMSSHLCDNVIKCYFNILGQVFTYWVHYWSLNRSQVFSEILTPH